MITWTGDCEAFTSAPNCLDVVDLKTPVIVTARKPRCCHLSSSYLGKKASEFQAPSERTLSSRVFYFRFTSEGNASDWDQSGQTPNRVLFTAHITQRAFANCLCSCGEGKERMLVGSEDSVQAPEAPKIKVTYSPTPSTSVKCDAKVPSSSFKNL